MFRRAHVALAAAALAAGSCGPLRLPKAGSPPEPARLRERSPDFYVTTADGSGVWPGRFLGRTLVIVGAGVGYVRDIVPWVRFVSSRYGGPGESYEMIAVVERASAGRLRRLRGVFPDEIELHADPTGDYPAALGLVGEGPHVAVVDAEGTLVGLVDGPLDDKRAQRLALALDALLRPAQAASRSK